MFTGLVEGQAVVRELLPEGDAVRLTIEFPSDVAGALTMGESVALNGCCLTVIAFDGTTAAFQAGTETLSKTNLGELRPGRTVNFERSLRADARLGGHIVQGHVDGTARVHAIDRAGEWVTMWFQLDPQLAKFMVPKGSVAVDGVSLTVVNAEPDRFSIALIPHTLEVTTLGQRAIGDTVNIETDILGKYVERLLAARFGNA